MSKARKKKTPKFLLVWDENVLPQSAKENIARLRDYGVQVYTDDAEMREHEAGERDFITFSIATNSKEKFVDAVNGIITFRGEVLGGVLKFVFDGADRNADWITVEESLS